MGGCNEIWDEPTHKTVPCTTCGHLTIFAGSKKCDICWELEHRLESYLARGGANAWAVVEKALNEAKILGRPPLPSSSG